MNSVGGSDESDGKVEGKREKRREEKRKKERKKEIIQVGRSGVFLVFSKCIECLNGNCVKLCKKMEGGWEWEKENTRKENEPSTLTATGTKIKFSTFHRFCNMAPSMVNQWN